MTMMMMMPREKLDRGTNSSRNSETDDENLSSLIPGTEIVVPGPFVVFQGNAGDGLSNTMQSLSTVPIAPRAVPSTSVVHNSRLQPGNPLNPLLEHEYESVEAPRPPALGQLVNAHITAAATRLVTAAAAAAASTNVSTAVTQDADDCIDPMSTSGMSSSQSRSSMDEFVVVGENNSFSPSRKNLPNAEKSPSGSNSTNQQGDALSTTDVDHLCIRQWEHDCREVEKQQRRDWIDSLRHVPPHLLDHCMMAMSVVQNGGDGSGGGNSRHHYHHFDGDEEEDVQGCPSLWWQLHGKVAVLKDLPIRDPATGYVIRSVIATLHPGTSVVGTKLIHLDSSTFEPINVSPIMMQPCSLSSVSDGGNMYSQGQKGWIQVLEVQINPNVMSMRGAEITTDISSGYVVLSLDGYPFLGPGFPSLYLNPYLWVWRVTCAVGAFVREGVELSTHHLDTIPYGCMIKVTKRCINNQGLSRLRAQGNLFDSTSASKSYRVSGWISELLNPLSGQRGIIAQPLPFPVPALYRVTLTLGAVIRKDIELSSPQIGTAPHGTILKIVGRAFSEHPVDKSIERLQLAGDGGWISVRLNRPPPHDEVVVEFVDIDESFDPTDPGRYHLKARRAVVEAERARRAATRNTQNYRSSNDDISSINEDDLLCDHDQDAIYSPTRHSSSNISCGHDSSVNPEALKCVVCLTSDRNACLVHGETGHIVCCLICARILKARGDKCPVCRLPISSVIQVSLKIDWIVACLQYSGI